MQSRADRAPEGLELIGLRYYGGVQFTDEGGPTTMKSRSSWLYTPLSAAIVAAMFAGAFILGYLLHPA